MARDHETVVANAVDLDHLAGDSLGRFDALRPPPRVRGWIDPLETVDPSGGRVEDNPRHDGLSQDHRVTVHELAQLDVDRPGRLAPLDEVSEGIHRERRPAGPGPRRRNAAGHHLRLQNLRPQLDVTEPHGHRTQRCLPHLIGLHHVGVLDGTGRGPVDPRKLRRLRRPANNFEVVEPAQVHGRAAAGLEDPHLDQRGVLEAECLRLETHLEAGVRRPRGGGRGHPQQKQPENGSAGIHLRRHQSFSTFPGFGVGERKASRASASARSSAA